MCFFTLEKRQDLYRVSVLGRTVYIIFLQWISFWNGCVLWKSYNVSACCFRVCPAGQLLAARRWELLRASHLYLMVLGEGAEGTVAGGCWAQDITAGSFPLASLQVEFEDVFCLFSYTGHGLLLLRACMSNLLCESAVGTYPGGWLWRFALLCSGALGRTWAG